MTTSPGSSSSSVIATTRPRLLPFSSNMRYALNFSTLDPLLVKRLRQVRLAQIVARLHFDQAADRALELIAAFGPRIQLRRWRGRGHDQLDAAVVKFVDEPDEAAHDVGFILLELRDARNQHRMVAPCELDVVGLAARTVA